MAKKKKFDYKKRKKMVGIDPQLISGWLNLEQAALYLGISKETIHRLLKKKAIPAFRIGRLWKFHHQELDFWIRSGESK